MPISPQLALTGVKLVTGALSFLSGSSDFDRQQELNNIRTNFQIKNIEDNEQILVEADINNKFRIQTNALKALGTSSVSAAFRGIEGKSIDEVEQEILSNEASALRKSSTELQSTLDQLANKEEQVLLDQNLFDLNEPDFFNSLLTTGVDIASTLFSVGQETGADKPLVFGGK